MIRDQIPEGPEALTPEWMTKVLRKRGVIKNAAVTTLKITPLAEAENEGIAGVVGNHAYLQLAYDIDEADAPQSLFAKFSNPDPDALAFMHSLGFFQKEVGFYEHIADKVDLRTPRCYYSALNTETGESLLLLEDLKPMSVGNLTAGCSLAQAELAIREIAIFHAEWWESPQLNALDWLPPPNIPALDAMYQQAWDPFVEKVGHLIPQTLLSICKRVRQDVGFIFRKHDEPPRTLVHHDYHMENQFFAAADSNDPFAVVDWNVLTIGHGVCDVVHFMGCLQTARAAHEMDLLHLYHTTLLENGVKDYSFEQCLLDFRHFALYKLWVLVFVIGTGRFDAEQQFRTAVDIVLPELNETLLRLKVSDLLPA